MLDAQLLTQVSIARLLTGVVYGSIGLAFASVYSVTSVINFPQADLGLAGAFAAVTLSKSLLVLGLVGAALVGALVSTLLFILVLVPLRRASVLMQTIALIGGGIVLQALMHTLVGTGPQILPLFIDGDPILINGAALPAQGIFVFTWGAFLAISLHAFLEWTLLGRAVCACAIDRYAAGLVGIPVILMAFNSLILGGAIIQ